MQGRYVKVNIFTNWGDGTWVTPTTIHVCDADGVKWNDENMTHDGTSPAGGGSLAMCSNTSTGDYWQPYISIAPWWQVDLGASHELSKIKLRVLPGYADRMIKDFAVSVSTDGSTFTEVLRGQAAHNDTEQIFEFVEGLSDDILINGTGSHSGGYEIAANGFDKTQSTYTQNQNSCPWWIKYDLGSGVTKVPAAYRLQLSSFGATYCPSAWKLWGSTAGTDCSVGDEAASGWTELDARTGVSWSSQYEERLFRIIPTAAAYRYLRWSFSAPNAPICLAELKAYSPPPPPPESAHYMNYLGTRGRDRMRSKGISLGEKVVADNNFSFLISHRDRLRTRGISLEQACVRVPPYNPASISGIMAWYAADMIRGLADGDTIAQWDDLSGNARHMLQAEAGRRPLYKIGIVNGLPALLFDSGDDVMATVASFTGMCTVVAVAKYVGASFGSYNGLFTGDGGNIWWIGSAGGTGWYTGESGGMTWYKDNVSGTSEVTNAWHCFIATHAGKTHVAQIGRDRSYDGRDWGGYIAEVAIYDNVLSADDRTLLDAYLRAKYAIA